MKKEQKSFLIRYGICFAIATLLSLSIIALKGWFTDKLRVNLQILSDAFFASGILFMLVYGLLFISSEGGFIGIGFALKRAMRVFIPIYRKNEETFAQYRERKLAKKSGKGDSCVFFTGLFFFLISLIFLIIWYKV